MVREAASSAGSAGAPQYAHIPQDARLISLIIASMGIQDIEPGVEMMLLEWATKYIHTILSDSLTYAAHAHPSTSSNPQINLPDLILAIQSNLSHSLIQTPAKSTLLSLASTLNATPLPPISDRFGLRLPPREHCLTNVNFRIVPDELEDEDEDDEDELELSVAADGNGPVGSQAEADRGEGISHNARQGEGDRGAAVVGEEDAADITMASAQTPASDTGGAQTEEERRGVKRSLDEDEDYD